MFNDYDTDPNNIPDASFNNLLHLAVWAASGFGLWLLYGWIMFG